MIGISNANGGSGAISSNKAVLDIRALTGSIITVSSNGDTIETLNIGSPYSDNNLISSYICAISSKFFGNIDIVATHQGVDYTKTVSVISSAYYNTTVTMNLYIFKDGDECTDITGGWYGYNNGYNTGSYLLVGDNDNGSVCVTNKAINMKYFNTVHYNGYRMRRADWNTQWTNAVCLEECGLLSSQTSGYVSVWNGPDVGVLNYDQNVSSIDQSCYVRVRSGKAWRCQGRAEQIYLVLS